MSEYPNCAALPGWKPVRFPTNDAPYVMFPRLLYSVLAVSILIPCMLQSFFSHLVVVANSFWRSRVCGWGGITSEEMLLGWRFSYHDTHQPLLLWNIWMLFYFVGKAVHQNST